MSRSTIADLLRQYSVESDEGETNLDEGQVGAEEVLVVTDEHTTELEESIEEIAETVNEKVEAEAALDSVIEATESLESAIAAIRQARLQGHRVNGVAMQIWAHGVVDSMEARHIPSEVFEALQSDYGDSFEADSYTDHSFEAEEKGEGILTKLWNMIKAAFARVRDWFTRFMAWFGKSAEAIEKAGRALKKKAEGKSSATTTVKKIPGAPYGVLVKGSKIDAVSVVGEIEFAISEASDASGVIFTGMSTAAQKLEKSNASEDAIKVLASKLKDFKTKAESKVDGGVKLKIEFKTDAKTGKVEYKSTLDMISAKAFKGEVAVMSIAEIKSLADALIKLGQNAGSNIRNVERNIGKVGNINVNKDLEGNALENARKAARTITAGMKIAQNMTTDTAKYLLPVAKKAYAFGAVCLNQYK